MRNSSMETNFRTDDEVAKKRKFPCVVSHGKHFNLTRVLVK